MPRWIDWVGIVFAEAVWMAMSTLIGAVLGALAALGVWWVITPPDAPHGGGLAIPGMLALGGFVGGAVGLALRIASAVHRDSQD
jgi:hypothetical protein